MQRETFFVALLSLTSSNLQTMLLFSFLFPSWTRKRLAHHFIKREKRRMDLWSSGRSVQWDATHQGSNPGDRTFFWNFSRNFRVHARVRVRWYYAFPVHWRRRRRLPITSLRVYGRACVCLRVVWAWSVCFVCEQVVLDQKKRIFGVL